MSARKKNAPKRGRPALPKGESKSVFALRLNDQERSMIATAAMLEGKPVALWAREALLRAATSGPLDRDPFGNGFGIDED